MATVANQVSPDRCGALLLALVLAGCGAVTTADPLVLADGGGAAGHDAELEHAAAGAGGSSAGASMDGGRGGAGAAGTSQPARDADVPELAPAGPPACTGSTETLYASACRDVGGLRCSTQCQDQRGASTPVRSSGCTQPGLPFTAGIAVLCVADCSACPPAAP